MRLHKDQHKPARDFSPLHSLAQTFMMEDRCLQQASTGEASAVLGENIAPTLNWDSVPPQTSSFALVMNDVDAAVAGGFHHWIVYNIPPSARALQGNAPYTEGTNSLNTRSYFGPCPPPTGQEHHYIYMRSPSIKSARERNT
jgi:phosphatidylethanolamine-binding protein (PEBP) family uncharacterized protein